MSEHEQQAAIGRTVEQYAACKKKLAALQSEATKIAEKLQRVGQQLRTIHQASISSIGPIALAIVNETGEFPTADLIKNTALEIKGELEHKAELLTMLKKLDLSPKISSFAYHVPVVLIRSQLRYVSGS